MKQSTDTFLHDNISAITFYIYDIPATQYDKQYCAMDLFTLNRKFRVFMYIIAYFELPSAHQTLKEEPVSEIYELSQADNTDFETESSVFKACSDILP